MRTVSYNACGASTCQNTVATADEWAAQFLERMNAVSADVIALQEVCAGQYEALKKLLVGYTSVREGAAGAPPAAHAGAAPRRSSGRRCS